MRIIINNTIGTVKHDMLRTYMFVASLAYVGSFAISACRTHLILWRAFVFLAGGSSICSSENCPIFLSLRGKLRTVRRSFKWFMTKAMPRFFKYRHLCRFDSLFIRWATTHPSRGALLISNVNTTFVYVEICVDLWFFLFVSWIITNVIIVKTWQQQHYPVLSRCMKDNSYIFFRSQIEMWKDINFLL